MNYLTYMLLLIFSVFICPLYSFQYHEIKSGKFDYEGQTGFVRLYQTDNQIGTQYMTVAIDDTLPLNNEVNRISRSISLGDINDDGWTDFTLLFKDYGNQGETADYYTYSYALQIYVSSVDTILGSDGLITKDIKYQTLDAYWAFVPKNATISHYDKVFMKDFDLNGYKDHLLLGWDDNQGNSTLYWQLQETKLQNSLSESINKGIGKIKIYSSIEDALVFQGQTYPFYSYLLIQSDTIAHIYRYDDQSSLFNKLKVIPFNQTIKKILPLTAHHPLLIQYNLLILIDKQLVLKHYSEKFENSVSLLVQSHSLNESQGYQLDEVYFIENNDDGKFAIWWQQSDGSGRLIFYSITQNDDGVKLKEESVDGYSYVNYDEKPFKVVYRSSNPIDNGAWAIVRANKEDIDTYSY